MNITTKTLSGAEISVAIGGQNTEIRNDGAATVYASANAGIVAGADGVVAIPAGAAVTVLDTRGRVYLLGTGEVSVVGKDTVSAVFKCAPSAGGSGQDDVARQAITAHAGNAEIHVTADEKAKWNAVNYSNPNLLINPDFRINQRGNSGYSSIGYGYDHWYVGRNTGSVNAANGKCTITCTDTADTQHIIQFIEGDYSGKTLTFSLNVEAIEGCTLSIRVADDNYATIGYGAISSVAGKVSCRADVPASFTGIIRVLIGFHEINAIGNYFTFSEPKLEIGTIATPFTPPDPATELAKCQRYFYRLGGKNRFFKLYGIAYGSNSLRFPYNLPVEMRTTPTITCSPGNWRFCIRKIPTDGAAYWNNEYGTMFAVDGSYSSNSNVDICVELDSSKTVNISAGDSVVLNTNSDLNSDGSQKYPGWLDFDAEL